MDWIRTRVLLAVEFLASAKRSSQLKPYSFGISNKPCSATYVFPFSKIRDCIHLHLIKIKTGDPALNLTYANVGYQELRSHCLFRCAHYSRLPRVLNAGAILGLRRRSFNFIL